MLTPQALATTFATVNESEPWSRVQEYRRVTEYTTHHPNKGSQAVATALNLPRARIRPWVDDNSKPDPARAIDTARNNNWLHTPPNSPPGRAWTRLVAWIYSGGSIGAEDHAPTFYVRQDQQKRLNKTELEILRTALDELDVSHKLRHRNPARPTQIVPGSNAVLVGRCLAALGAPTGKKNTETPTSLPDWVVSADRETRGAFCRVYLLNRGTYRNREPRFAMREERADEYHDALAALFDSLLETGTVSRSGHTIYVSGGLADELLAA